MIKLLIAYDMQFVENNKSYIYFLMEFYNKSLSC